MLDTIIIGGGAAGLSAALYLGRLRLQVMVFDTGTPANRFSHAAHSFFTRDGTKPSELLAIGREQLKPYTTVEIRPHKVEKAEKQGDYFTVQDDTGEIFTARKILLAMGLRDTMPDIQGATEYWGHGVFHCPFCDGWENRDKKIAVIGEDESFMHIMSLLYQLSHDLVLCTNGDSKLGKDDERLLAKRGIQIIKTPIKAITGNSEQLEAIVFEDGQVLECDAVFLRPISKPQSTLAEDLGCQVDENQLILVDSMGRSSVEGVYAAGDIAQVPRNLSFVVRSGAAAAFAMIQDIVHDDFWA